MKEQADSSRGNIQQWSIRTTGRCTSPWNPNTDPVKPISFNYIHRPWLIKITVQMKDFGKGLSRGTTEESYTTGSTESKEHWVNENCKWKILQRGHWRIAASTAGLAVVFIQVTISISRVERQPLMTGFAYQTLAAPTQGGQSCHIQHHKLLQKVNQRGLIELKAATHQPRPWAPAEYQPKFAQWLQWESAVPHWAH